MTPYALQRIKMIIFAELHLTFVLQDFICAAMQLGGSMDIFVMLFQLRKM